MSRSLGSQRTRPAFSSVAAERTPFEASPQRAPPAARPDAERDARLVHLAEITRPSPLPLFPEPHETRVNPRTQAAKRLTLEQVSSLPITNEATIDETFLDSNRHMNVSWYLHLFNRATGEMYRALGVDWSELRDSSSSSFILEGHIRYLSEVLIGEHVTVRTRLVGRSAKRVHFLHLMFNDDKQTIAATYEKVMAHMDMKTRRMAPYPKPIQLKLDAIFARHQSLDWDPPVCGVMQA